MDILAEYKNPGSCNVKSMRTTRSYIIREVFAFAVEKNFFSFFGRWIAKKIVLSGVEGSSVVMFKDIVVRV